VLRTNSWKSFPIHYVILCTCSMKFQYHKNITVIVHYFNLNTVNVIPRSRLIYVLMRIIISSSIFFILQEHGGDLSSRAHSIMTYTDRRTIRVPVGRRSFPDHDVVCFYIIIIIYILYTSTWPLRDGDDCRTARCTGQRRYFQRVAFFIYGKSFV